MDHDKLCNFLVTYKYRQNRISGRILKSWTNCPTDERVVRCHNESEAARMLKAHIKENFRKNHFEIHIIKVENLPGPAEKRFDDRDESMTAAQRVALREKQPIRGKISRGKTKTLTEYAQDIEELDRNRLLLSDTSRQLSSDELKGYLAVAEEEIALLSQSIDRQAFLIGKVLSSVKQKLARGEFKAWVIDKCPFSIRQTYNLISLYKVTSAYPELANLKRSAIYLVGSNNFPEELREYLADSLVGVYDVGLQDIVRLQTGYVNGEIDLDDDAFTKTLKLREEEDIYKIRSERFKRSIDRLNQDTERYEAMITQQRRNNDKYVFSDDYKMYREAQRILKGTIWNFKELVHNGPPDYAATQNRESRKPSVAQSRYKELRTPAADRIPPDNGSKEILRKPVKSKIDKYNMVLHPEGIPDWQLEEHDRKDAEGKFCPGDVINAEADITEDQYKEYDRKTALENFCPGDTVPSADDTPDWVFEEIDRKTALENSCPV